MNNDFERKKNLEIELQSKIINSKLKGCGLNANGITCKEPVKPVKPPVPVQKIPTMTCYDNLQRFFNDHKKQYVDAVKSAFIVFNLINHFDTVKKSNTLECDNKFKKLKDMVDKIKDHHNILVNWNNTLITQGLSECTNSIKDCGEERYTLYKLSKPLNVSPENNTIRDLINEIDTQRESAITSANIKMSELRSQYSATAFGEAEHTDPVNAFGSERRKKSKASKKSKKRKSKGKKKSKKSKKSKK